MATSLTYFTNECLEKNYVGTTVNSGMKDKGAILILMVFGLYNYTVSTPDSNGRACSEYLVGEEMEGNSCTL
jgi:hypothetical protein